MIRLLSILVCALVFASCSNSEFFGAYGVIVPDGEYEGLQLVRSSGRWAVLGTTEENVPLIECGQMWVYFDYDFHLGKHEVTLGEFSAIAKKDLALQKWYLARSVPQDSANYPVTGVTYFDAVLYANARSKAEHLDTAYEYNSASYDEYGNCTNLEGLVFHPEMESYRLPTEAEWNFAAVEVWDPSLGWNSENSGYRIHEVCTAADSSRAFCDMAGNVAEWVNDWKVGFRDTAVTDFVGAPAGIAFSERVLKGGSYKNGESSTHMYARGDVYMVTSSTQAPYAGFRIALGRIPNPLWLSHSSRFVTDRTNLLVNSSTMRNYTGTYKTKLVFRNDVSGNLSFVDFSSITASVTEIVDTLDSYHPDVSPDGKRVAFCTGIEGVDGKSSVYVRDLNASGSNLQKLDVESAAIPRWRVLESGDTVIVYVTSAANNKGEESFRASSTWMVPFANGRFGVPVKIADGSYHGGVSADGRLAVTGARLLRSASASGYPELSAAPATSVWYEGEQACNASLSQDGSKRTLFLDFGGGAGREFAGRDYGIHEMLLVADSAGKLVQGVPAPAAYSFDHSEWAVSSAENLAVATLTNADGVHEKVVLVNLADSSLLDMVEGEELWHPALWAAPVVPQSATSRIDPDSAGAYLVDMDIGHFQLRYKMELLWRFVDSTDVVVVGSSRPLYSVAPLAFGPKFKVLNLAQTPNSIHMSRDFLHRYVFGQMKRLKYVVLSLDIDFWWKGEGEDNFFASDYKSVPGYVYDENHDYWKAGVPGELVIFTEQGMGLPEGSGLLDSRGFLANDCLFWGEQSPGIDKDSTFLDGRHGLLEASMASLRDIVEEAGRHGVTVVGVVFPMSPHYRNTGAFGRYGLRRSVADSLLRVIDGLTERFPNFVLMDENKMGNHDYSDYYALDFDHLCTLGAIRITGRLDSLLQEQDVRNSGL